MEYLYVKTHTRRRLFPGALRCLSRLLLWAMLCFGLYQGAALACAQQELSQKVVRFHILAHSDTAADQSVKLSVRDAVLKALSPGLSAAPTREAALAYLYSHRDAAAQAAQEALAAQGLSLPVTVTLGRELFPQKTYGSLTFPAGRYTALRIVLGEGAGQNWWCVLYPALCLTSAQAADDDDGNRARLAQTLSENALALVAEESAGPEFRLKLADWWASRLAAREGFAAPPEPLPPA